jgi:hypothetical protein
MAIDEIDEETMRATIGEVLSPARAISSPEHLKGRQNSLKEIDRSLAMPGRHIFIYGDRGVGKTSLALTSAHIHQSADADPITVSCDTETDLFRLVRDIGNQAVGNSPGVIEKKSLQSGFSFKFLSGSKTSEITRGQIPALETINECVDIIRYLQEIHSLKPIVVIDEFDRIKSKKHRRQFAEFLKKIGDSDVATRFLICGIATSLDHLLDEHLSIARNISSIELKRLSHDARWAIIEEACDRLGVIFPRDMILRIGQISDGFPHYVHLVGEKIFWEVFDDTNKIETASRKHFDDGVRAAVLSSEALPRATYAKATQHYADDYSEVLWAVADGPHLARGTPDIYTKSYLEIMKYRKGREPLNRTTFSNRLNRLKMETHGEILEALGHGWFKFSDAVVRGYVRLKAQEEGIEVGDGYFNAA